MESTTGVYSRGYLDRALGQTGKHVLCNGMITTEDYRTRYTVIYTSTDQSQDTDRLTD